MCTGGPVSALYALFESEGYGNLDFFKIAIKVFHDYYCPFNLTFLCTQKGLTTHLVGGGHS